MPVNLEMNPNLVAQTHPYSQLQFSHSFDTKTAPLTTPAGQEVLSTLFTNLVLFLSVEMHHLPSPVITLSVSHLTQNTGFKEFYMHLKAGVGNFDLPSLLIK